MKIDFCVPVFNEGEIFDANAERIWQFLSGEQRDYEWRLVFIVNGSTPSFEKQVNSFVSSKPTGVFSHIIAESGKGRAIKAYFNASSADVLVYMDIDLAVDLGALSRLVGPIINLEADLVFGSRMLPSSSIKRSWLRETSSRAYLEYSRLILKHQYSDLQCGFKAIKASAWQQLAPNIKNDNWFFDTELIYFAQKQGFRLKEIPVNWSENRYSDRHSKINILSDGWRFLVETLALRRRG
ncbi:MAG: glycosyltransferase [bacterium]|nr:glycosyltransferase [bacterium]